MGEYIHKLATRLFAKETLLLFAWFAVRGVAGVLKMDLRGVGEGEGVKYFGVVGCRRGVDFLGE